MLRSLHDQHPKQDPERFPPQAANDVAPRAIPCAGTTGEVSRECDATSSAELREELETQAIDFIGIYVFICAYEPDFDNRK